MTRDEIIDALQALESELRRRHVVHAGVFGSQARGDANPEGDIDIILKFDPEAGVGLFDFVGVARFVRVLLKRRLRKDVDVVDHDGLRPRMRERVDRDGVYAF